MSHSPVIPFRVPGAVLCAVTGFPVSHSRSPFIHRAFAEQFGLPLQYERVEVRPGLLSSTLAELRELGCRGVNVTVPLKEEAAALATQASVAVQATGAANTLWWSADDALCADNTDGVGLVRDLTRNWGMSLNGHRLAILGAGGAAAGVIPPLFAAGVAGIVLINRSEARAEALVERFQSLGALSTLQPTGRVASPVDLIINATSAGLSGNTPTFPSTLLSPATHCYDMFYASTLTPFLAACRASAGCTELRDGMGMLVEQAAAAFTLWHGLEPATSVVLSALRAR
ncbi:MAG: shikimate dehydrogenase [Gammaproteobacteria bacterium]|nr:shikimate dehydrogenase [Gammaproteobacteria bacterium]